jgi:rubredoxin
MTDTCWLCGHEIHDPAEVVGVIRPTRTRVAHRACLRSLAELELDLRADRPAEPDPICDICGGTGWAQVPDPFFGGALVDQRCPACCDTTVRAHTPRWEGDNGQKSGPG